MTLFPFMRMNGSTTSSTAPSASPRDPAGTAFGTPPGASAPLPDQGPDSLGAVVDRLGSLGDPTRMRILLVLDRGEFAVGELCQALQLPQSTVSRHLRTLSDAGWVGARSEGTSRVYRRAAAHHLPDGDLWRVVRGSALASPEAREDGERADAILAERRERSRTFFRSAAGRWDALRRELFGGRTDAQALLGLLEPEWVVGDLGCGTGALTASLAPCVARVVAVDREPEMLEAAARRLEGVENVELRQGDLEVLPLEDGTLDAVFALLVFHLLPDPEAVLSEAFRVLRPGGRLVLLDMRAHTRDEYREEMGHLWAGFEPSVVEGWMAEVGFEGIRMLPLPPDPEARGPLSR
jgi:ubiquinone/menaquinone biosynthesis C-methylase UbiE